MYSIKSEYIECPQKYSGKGKSIFLAGGITDCPDWQKEIIDMLKDEKIVLLNPRRNSFDLKKNMSKEQIIWEHKHLKKATAILFWFPKETLCPITLYELGAWSMTNKKIFIGIHPNYKRKTDVEIQTKLARSDIKIVYSVTDLVNQIKSWNKLNNRVSLKK